MDVMKYLESTQEHKTNIKRIKRSKTATKNINIKKPMHSRALEERCKAKGSKATSSKSNQKTKLYVSGSQSYQTKQKLSTKPVQPKTIIKINPFQFKVFKSPKKIRSAKNSSHSKRIDAVIKPDDNIETAVAQFSGDGSISKGVKANRNMKFSMDMSKVIEGVKVFEPQLELSDSSDNEETSSAEVVTKKSTSKKRKKLRKTKRSKQTVLLKKGNVSQPVIKKRKKTLSNLRAKKALTFKKKRPVTKNSKTTRKHIPKRSINSV